MTRGKEGDATLEYGPNHSKIGHYVPSRILYFSLADLAEQIETLTLNEVQYVMLPFHPAASWSPFLV